MKTHLDRRRKIVMTNSARALSYSHYNPITINKSLWPSAPHARFSLQLREKVLNTNWQGLIIFTQQNMFEEHVNALAVASLAIEHIIRSYQTCNSTGSSTCFKFNNNHVPRNESKGT